MYQLNPASLDSDNSNIKSESLLKKSTNNRTYKNRKNVNFSDDEKSENNNTTTDADTKNKLSNISSLISKLHTTNEDDEDDNNFQNNLKTETPNLLPVDSNVVANEIKKMSAYKDNLINNTGYLNTNVNTNYTNYEDGYKSNINYMNNSNNPNNMNNLTNLNDNVLSDNNSLLAKLDYIVHLLEEQHNEKTNHITEELILYLFLGIFIIFVLDSFARASKYVR